jgi:dTDP-4-amino-4,6-dideoxygalactose transaminase
MKFIPFNRPWLPPAVKEQLVDLASDDHKSFDKDYISACIDKLSGLVNGKPVLLTSSCTHALETAALLIDIKPGDEIIMPSFTFVSSANAFVLRGAIPVFVDIRPDTLNIDEALIEKAITPRTRAILAVHYAGVAAEMNKINAIAKKYQLYVIEDAAHGILASLESNPLGALSDLGCMSFDISKNIQCFKGGALVVNNEKWLQRARIIVEKGTNRYDHTSGKADHYTWIDMGSNYAMSFLNAAYLYYQLESAGEISDHRMQLWNRYLTSLSKFSAKYGFRLPSIPGHCQHNAHIFYMICRDNGTRNGLIRHFAENGITAPFHFIPLHSSPAGMKYGRFHGDDKFTTQISECIIRLPLFHELQAEDIDGICEKTVAFFRDQA